MGDRIFDFIERCMNNIGIIGGFAFLVSSASGTEATKAFSLTVIFASVVLSLFITVFYGE